MKIEAGDLTPIEESVYSEAAAKSEVENLIFRFEGEVPPPGYYEAENCFINVLEPSIDYREAGFYISKI